MRQKLLLLLAAFFGVVAFFLMYNQIESEKLKAMKGARNLILMTASRDLVEGQKISLQDFSSVETKRFGSTTEISQEQFSQCVGKTLAFNIRRGQTLRWNDIVGLDDSRRKGMAGIVPEGLRAISIAVDNVSSVTNLVKPNDNVDIVGTFRFPAMKGDQEMDTLTLTILQNVQILATGQELAQARGSPVFSSASKDDRTKGYSTVTLGLTPKEVEFIIFASQKGRLDLSLRNSEDTSFETKLQSVNFKFIEGNIDQYNQERQKRKRSGK